ncbi:hypothetical protein L2E82_06026 [Cichorium intybus]|uniref:Uncharacterized protein n=1 Tax=Cichorium intybus TaxID=13427 RepID=A0ACB9HAF1_CICIN|nr:hypothetical protein L2E82_06026 [Cichorium intybus]
MQFTGMPLLSLRPQAVKKLQEQIKVSPFAHRLSLTDVILEEVKVCVCLWITYVACVTDFQISRWLCSRRPCNHSGEALVHQSSKLTNHNTSKYQTINNLEETKPDARIRRGRTPTPGRYLGLRSARGHRGRSRTYSSERDRSRSRSRSYSPSDCISSRSIDSDGAIVCSFFRFCNRAIEGFALRLWDSTTITGDHSVSFPR